MTRILSGFIIYAFFAGVSTPERQVANNVLTSKHDPVVIIRLPPKATYH